MPVNRISTQPSGGAVARDQNLRLERDQRADLELFRQLTATTKRREEEVALRVAQTRAKAKYSLGVAPVDARSVLVRYESSWRTFAPGRQGLAAKMDAGLLPTRGRSS